MGQQPIDLHPSTQWAIANVTAKGALGMSETIFDLVNVHTVRAHRLRVVAGGIGKGFPFSYSPKSSMSNYACFNTYRAVNFDDFDGVVARMIGGSAVLYSWCSLTLWDGIAYKNHGLVWARMSGWGVSTPNIGVDHGVASIIYGDGDPLGVLETIAEVDLPPTPEQVHMHVQITMKDDSLVVVLDGDVLFDFDKFIVKPEADKPLKQAAAIIKAARRSGSVVLINGHTDNIGKDDYNQQLSEERAKAVKQWFVSRNYFADYAIRTSGFGKSAPKESNEPKRDAPRIGEWKYSSSIRDREKCARQGDVTYPLYLSHRSAHGPGVRAERKSGWGDRGPNGHDGQREKSCVKHGLSTRQSVSSRASREYRQEDNCRNQMAFTLKPMGGGF